MKKTFSLATLFAGVAVLGLIGCGGGAKDGTSVALKPNKEEPAAGGTTTGGNGGTTTNGSTPAQTKAGFGGIKGRVVLAKGDPVPMRGIKIAKGAATVNPEYCAANNAILDNSLVVNPENRGVASVFIYLKKKPKGGKDKTAESEKRPTIFDQENCTFVPHGMVMMTGQDITVKSQDPVPHNVHTYPLGEDGFNKVIDPTNKDGEQMSYHVSQQVPCNVKCDFHKWMSAYQLPLDHPYAAVTDEAGNFSISDLPSGTHEFVIWHENKGYLERGYEITVDADKTNDVGEISFSLGRLAQGEFRGPKPKVVNISSLAKN